MLRKLSIILVILFLSIGMVTAEESWVTILDISDPKNDDYGPGTYLYPTHPQFEPYQGMLDIERFKVEENGELLKFEITFGQITNPWDGPHGFSHQLIEIYIDHSPGGSRRPFLPGARVVFSPKARWDTLIKITGWHNYLFHYTDERLNNPEPYSKAQVRVLEDQKTIEIQVPVSDVATPQDLTESSFYLLVGGQDGFGPDNYRVVKDEVSEWYFGGTDGKGFTPNVIDIVTPSNKSQKRILGSYDSINRIYAVVEPVKKPNLIKKILVYLTSIIVGLLLWYGWRKREELILD